MTFIGEKGYLPKWEYLLPKGNFLIITQERRVSLFEPDLEATTKR
jgi:hypothetical protein